MRLAYRRASSVGRGRTVGDDEVQQVAGDPQVMIARRDDGPAAVEKRDDDVDASGPKRCVMGQGLHSRYQKPTVSFCLVGSHARVGASNVTVKLRERGDRHTYPATLVHRGLKTLKGSVPLRVSFTLLSSTFVAGERGLHESRLEPALLSRHACIAPRWAMLRASLLYLVQFARRRYREGASSAGERARPLQKKRRAQIVVVLAEQNTRDG